MWPTFGRFLSKEDKMQTWYYRLPPAVSGLITAALVFVATFGVTELYALDPSSNTFPDSVVGRLVMSAAAGVFGGLAAVLLSNQRIRRVYGSPEHAFTYAYALRTGQLPRDIDPGVWQRWLDVSRQSIAWSPVTIAVYGGLAALQLVFHMWALALVFAVLTIWAAVTWRVMRRRVLRLATAVSQRQGD
jgi:hypothetical protein